LPTRSTSILLFSSRDAVAPRALIEPYVDQRLVEKVKAKQLLSFTPVE
jgi:hypothetical protein